MQLLTKAIERQLDKNWPDDKGLCKPAVKFFNPSGLGTWLIVSRDPEWPDCLFGLAGGVSRAWLCPPERPAIG